MSPFFLFFSKKEVYKEYRMKKFFSLLAIPVFLFSTTPHTQAASILGIGIDEEKKETEESNLFQTLAQYRNTQQVLLGLEIELRQEEERTFPEDEEITSLSQEIKNIDSEIKNLTEEEQTQELAKKQEERNAKQFLLEQKSQTLNENFELHLQKIEQLKSDIRDTEGEIEKLAEFSKTQAINLLIRIGFFFGFIILLLLLRFISAKMIGRLSGYIPIPRERALFRLNGIIFNLLIIITIIAALFSQALSILPILAILGTALAFALRNVISSFIAWFVIGTEQGYKIGDLIEVRGAIGEPFRGRVLEVHPLTTVLRQTGMRGDTGQILSFPNKVIFEDQIRNFSKMYRFIYIMIEFLVEDGTDVEIARQDLYDSIMEGIGKDIEEARKNLPNLQTKFGITEDQILPQIFIEPDPKGLMLRGKYFCRLDSRHGSRTEITRRFLERIKAHPQIKLRFVQFGDPD